MQSCKEIMQLDKLKTYTIKEGAHFCNERFPLMMNLRDGIKGEFILGESSVPNKEHDQINKLVGLSIGIDPHINSLRLGWMYFDSKFHIYAYVYYKQQRHWKLIKSIEVGQKVRYNISLIDGTPIIEVDNLSVQFDFIYNGKNTNGMLLFPYYGGTIPTPNKIELQLSISDTEI